MAEPQTEWNQMVVNALAYGSIEALEKSVGALSAENCQSLVVEVPEEKWAQMEAENDPATLAATTLFRTIWEVTPYGVAALPRPPTPREIFS